MIFPAVIFAGTDSTRTRIQWGFSAGPVNFVDYAIIRQDFTNKAAWYQGFDASVIMRLPKKKFQLEIGVLGGNNSPISNLNYYIGSSHVLSSPAKKNVLEVSPRVMYSYYSEAVGSSKLRRRELSLQVGLSYFRRFNRFELGAGYYAWISQTKITLRSADSYPDSGRESLLYARTGIVPTGVVKVTCRILIFG